MHFATAAMTYLRPSQAISEMRYKPLIYEGVNS
jgi:hypothetical protein